MRALQQGIASQEQMREIYDWVQQLRAFKQWLNSRAVRATFRTPADVLVEAVAALNDWRMRHRDAAAATIVKDTNLERYLRYLWEVTRFIDIRGLQSGSGRLYQFAIDDLYIPLKRKASLAFSRPAPGSDATATPTVAWRAARRPATVILAAAKPPCCATWPTRLPGAGSASTPMRRVSSSESRANRHFHSSSGYRNWPRSWTRRLAGNAADTPATADSPDWLLKFLVEGSRANRWGLDEAYYRDRLESDAARAHGRFR